MVGEILQHIWAHAFDENAWLILETDKRLYSLRMGGFKGADTPGDFYAYNRELSEFEGQQITHVYSDNSMMYILTERGGVISHGATYISGDGTTSLAVRYNLLDDSMKQTSLKTTFSHLPQTMRVIQCATHKWR